MKRFYLCVNDKFKFKLRDIFIGGQFVEGNLKNFALTVLEH